jgi:hypothetical protein
MGLGKQVQAFARVENHYFKNKGFFPTDSFLLDNMDKIRHIRAVIVQVSSQIPNILVEWVQILHDTCSTWSWMKRTYLISIQALPLSSCISLLPTPISQNVCSGLSNHVVTGTMSLDRHYSFMNSEVRECISPLSCKVADPKTHLIWRWSNVISTGGLSDWAWSIIP